MQTEEILIAKPKLPARGKAMSREHANYLHRIFSSPSLCLNEFLFDELRIYDNDIRNYFKITAQIRINALINIAQGFAIRIRNPSQLIKKKGIRFHTLWIAKRPLLAMPNTTVIQIFDHWALKFEGKSYLMTVEFFWYNEEHGIILTKLLPNTRLNRRFWWYYWLHDEYVDDTLQCQHFNQSWTTLKAIHSDDLASCDEIGVILCEWLTYNDHQYVQYKVVSNNCQHFVRDIVATFDIKMAKKLNSFISSRFLPYGRNQGKRTKNIGAILQRKLVRYRKLKKQAQKVSPQIKSSKDRSDAWLVCARELGIDFSASDNENSDSNHSIVAKEKYRNVKNIEHIDIDDEYDTDESVMEEKAMSASEISRTDSNRDEMDYNESYLKFIEPLEDSLKIYKKHNLNTTYSFSSE